MVDKGCLRGISARVIAELRSRCGLMRSILICTRHGEEDFEGMAEGEFVRRIRACVGPKCPFAISWTTKPTLRRRDDGSLVEAHFGGSDITLTVLIGRKPAFAPRDAMQTYPPGMPHATGSA